MITVLFNHGLKSRDVVEHRYLFTKVMDQLHNRFIEKGRNYKIVTNSEDDHPFAYNYSFQRRYDYEKDLIKIANFIKEMDY
jgi:hypothetical protein